MERVCLEHSICLDTCQHLVIPIDGINRCQVRATNKFAKHMSDVIGQPNKYLNIAQQWHKYYVDEKGREVSYEVDQQVLVSIVNVKLKVPGARKLLSQWNGPFQITEEIRFITYHVWLPYTFKIQWCLSCVTFFSCIQPMAGFNLPLY